MQIARSEAQNNITKVITINPGENSVLSSLPFDKPIILKWISKDPIFVQYAGLITINKGDISYAYRNFAQLNEFYTDIDSKNLVHRDKKNNILSEVTQENLITSSSVNTDGKYEINIFIHPLKPNHFYDIKILRKPTSTEQDLFVDLFSSAKDLPMFERKLKQINLIKKPFEIDYINGPKIGQLIIPELLSFYDTYLKKSYTALNDAIKGKDKDAIATITTQIKTILLITEPPNGYKQAAGYVQIFEAIKKSDDGALQSSIHQLNNLQLGYLAPPDADHVGDLAAADLKKFYTDYPQISSMLKQWEDLPDGGKKDTAKHDLEAYLIKLNLPFASDFFTFGQTLSSSTEVVDFDTRTGFTITADFGYIYYGFQEDFSSMTPYVGFELEFRYFDKNIPFNLIRPKTIWHYLSFTTGLTLTSIKKDGKRDDFFASKSLLTGIGFRLSSATRVTAGAMWFNREDVNPVLDKKHLAVTPYIGLSIDLKLKSLMNDFYSLSPTKKP